MSAVDAVLTVVSRAEDPTRYKLQVDRTSSFTLATTDSGYASDTPAFATTVYNYYNNEVSGTDNTATSVVQNVEIQWRLWVGGTLTSEGGSTHNEGVIGAISSHTDLENELNTHIAHLLTGDQVPPGA